MYIIDKIATILFKFKYRKNIKYPSVVIGYKGIKIGKNSIIQPFSTLKANKENTYGKIIIGKNTYIGEHSYILGGNGSVHIGNDFHAGNNLILLGGGDIYIGNNVLMSQNIVVSSSSHEFKDTKVMANETASIFNTVIISDNVFIGANATILMGTTIERGAIIGAGSVVTENTIIKEDEIWAGNPAKMIRTRISLKEQIEEEIDNFLKQYPFHNLFLLYGFKDIFASEYGGTCSDRTILFKEKLDEKFQEIPINIKLHRAFINDKQTHTILKIKIYNKVYFCDVGMGYPITKLLPSYQNIKFNSYGIKFKSVVEKNNITVYIDEGDGEKELIKIVNEVQSQEDIRQSIDNRWESREELPFNNRLRYFFIYKNIYYQIRDNDFSFNCEAKRIYYNPK